MTFTEVSMSLNLHSYVPVLRSIPGLPPRNGSGTAGPVEVPLPGLEQPVRGYPNPLTAPSGEGGRYTPLPPNRVLLETFCFSSSKRTIRFSLKLKQIGSF